MTHIITSLCLRDGACIEVCPVECIIPGQPVAEWPWMYIDPDTCIDCGACIPECPFEAIFPEDEVPDSYAAKDGTIISDAAGTEPYDAHTKVGGGGTVTIAKTRKLKAGDTIDLKPGIEPNYKFFKEGPGYNAK